MTHRVTLFGRHVGRLAVERGRLAFTYDEGVLGDPDQVPVSVRLPVRSETYGDADTRAFFENLLPEDEYRRLLAAGLRLSHANTAGLLGAIGGECAGAVSVWPPGSSPPGGPRHRGLADDDLRALFAVPGDDALIEAQREGRLSLAGAQTTHLLIRWVAFNYLIGNEDAHGKNLALLYTSEGLRLAPFYDLRAPCTRG